MLFTSVKSVRFLRFGGDMARRAWILRYLLEDALLGILLHLVLLKRRWK